MDLQKPQEETHKLKLKAGGSHSDNRYSSDPTIVKSTEAPRSKGNLNDESKSKLNEILWELWFKKPYIIAVLFVAVVWWFFTSPETQNPSKQETSLPIPKTTEDQPTEQTKVAQEPTPQTAISQPQNQESQKNLTAPTTLEIQPVDNKSVRDQNIDTIKQLLAQKESDQQSANIVNAKSSEDLKQENIQKAISNMQITTVLYQQSESRMILNGRIYFSGDLVDPENQLRWTHTNTAERRITLEGPDGIQYLKSY